MKSLTYILLSLCLFLGQTGIPVWAHFCKGEAQGISLFAQQEKCQAADIDLRSSCCAHDHEQTDSPSHQDNNEDGDCCSDELSFFRLAQVEFFPVDGEAYQADVLSDRPAEVQIEEPLLLAKPGCFYQQTNINDPPLSTRGRLLRISMSSFLC
ncbi:MAG: hypothetical protein AAF741_13470 [Bacteroidota bacterium]